MEIGWVEYWLSVENFIDIVMQYKLLLLLLNKGFITYGIVGQQFAIRPPMHYEMKVLSRNFFKAMADTKALSSKIKFRFFYTF